jgi:hypothetical protein
MQVSRIIAAIVLAMAVSISAGEAQAAETLVVKAGDGSYGPGVALSWKTAGNAVLFRLSPDVDGATVATFLSERLANAKVVYASDELAIEGIPEPSLLDQLSTLSLSGASDPLAELGGLGGAVVAMDTPEGGGSIRASKLSGVAALPGGIGVHDPKERVEAEVVTVTRAAFPLVVLKVKIRRSAKAGPLKTKLRRGKVLELPVVYATTSDGLDLRVETNRQNLVAYYLERGDRINLHVVAGEDDVFEADWLARVKTRW